MGVLPVVEARHKILDDRVRKAFLLLPEPFRPGYDSRLAAILRYQATRLECMPSAIAGLVPAMRPNSAVKAVAPGGRRT